MEIVLPPRGPVVPVPTEAQRRDFRKTCFQALQHRDSPCRSGCIFCLRRGEKDYEKAWKEFESAEQVKLHRKREEPSSKFPI